jgi:hypothetical protein
MTMPFAPSRILPLPVDARPTYGALRAELEAGGTRNPELGEIRRAHLRNFLMTSGSDFLPSSSTVFGRLSFLG